MHMHMSSGSAAAHVNTLNAIFSENAFPGKLHTVGYVLSKWKQTGQKTTFEHKVGPNGKERLHCWFYYSLAFFIHLLFSWIQLHLVVSLWCGFISPVVTNLCYSRSHHITHMWLSAQCVLMCGIGGLSVCVGLNVFCLCVFRCEQ